MNIKYSKKKEELRKDPVMDSIEKARVFMVNHGNKLIIGLIVVVLALAGLQIFSYLQKKKMIEVQEDFGRGMLLFSKQDEANAIEAFNGVVEEHGNTAHAAYSAYMIGHMHLFKENYQEATEYFNKALQNKQNKSFVKGEALVGLATCAEAKGELQESLDFFEKALSEKTIEYRYPAIHWKMALLYKKLGNKEKVEYYCNELISDTLALDYRKKAEGLLATSELL